jgi:tetratricopeptide (TPR) repeat protein
VKERLSNDDATGQPVALPESVKSCEKVSRWMQRGLLGAVCVFVIGVYAYSAHSGFSVSASPKAADEYYNLLVQGFQSGKLSLKKELGPDLARLPASDPFPSKLPDGLLDLSYYKGRLFLYFGVTPAVVLLWPYVVLTGHYLHQKDAVLVFCSAGFLVGAIGVFALWRRHFAEVSFWVVLAAVVAFGLSTGVLPLLARCDVYEVAISCGFAFTMLSLAAVWKSLEDSKRRGMWLALASLSCGLAVGARPSLVFGAAILLLPVIYTWHENGKVGTVLSMAVLPIAIIGVGLMVYNFLRFENPFEHGFRYQLTDDRPLLRPLFSLDYLWLNLRVYFLAPSRWAGQFPLVHPITLSDLPKGYGGVEDTFGIFPNVPFALCALALPLAWWRRSAETRSALRTFSAALTLLLFIDTLTLCLYFRAFGRYEVEFLPQLVLLAIIGVFGVERAWLQNPVVRNAARGSWVLLLAYSVTFNWLAAVENSAKPHNNRGTILLQQGHLQEAIHEFEQALRLNPDFAEAHYNTGSALLRMDRIQDAISQFKQALQINPGYALAHNDLGVALQGTGQLQSAIRQYELALQIMPDYAEAHNNLGPH